MLMGDFSFSCLFVSSFIIFPLLLCKWATMWALEWEEGAWVGRGSASCSYVSTNATTTPDVVLALRNLKCFFRASLPTKVGFFFWNFVGTKCY